MLYQTSLGICTRQSGATLIIALVLLVVLTLLSLQGMRTNLTQERMAGNMGERHLAFQAAEAALRMGESTRPFPENGTSLTNAQTWDGVSPSPTDTFEDFDPNLSADPGFHIGAPQYVRVGIALPPQWRRLYPVTAIGFGAQDTSIVVVQSSFEPVGD